MPSIRIKICGVKTAGDAELAVRHGADAIGINFYEASPRFVTRVQAAEILRVLPPFVEPVAVLVQPNRHLLEETRHPVGIHTVQLHGADPTTVAETISAIIFRVILAQGVDSQESLARCRRNLKIWNEHGVNPAALLIDARVPGLHGGTGQTAPWELLADFRAGVPLILAGGLTPDNVAEAIRIVRPYAVDVAGGVESSPGVKDEEKVRRFVGNAREAAERVASG